MEKSFWQKTPLFANLSPNELKEIKKRLKKKTYPAGSLIFREDEPGDTLYIIEKGRVRITKTSFKDKDKILAVLKPGDFFGEMAILDEELRSATAQAEEEVRLLIAERKVIENLIRKNPKITLEMSRVLVRRLREADRQISRMERREEMHNRILEAQEAERKRIARDIHDGPAQGLANLTMKAQLCKRLMDKNPDKLKDELNQLEDTTQESLKSIRNLISNLRPLTLDELGLLLTLREHIERMQESADFKISLKVPKEESLPPQIENSLFYIIQEALNNIKKHARAKNVEVCLETLDDKLIVTIEDDGKGFNQKEVEKNYARQGSLGLISMKERAELIEGSFEISSGPGKGTKIKVTVPLIQSTVHGRQSTVDRFVKGKE